MQSSTLLTQLVEKYNISPTTVRVAFVTFTDYSILRFNYKAYDSKYSVSSAIRQTTYETISPLTVYDRLLSLISTTLFTETAGDRANAPNKVIIITDGTTSTESRSAIRNAAQTVLNNAQIYVIGYGSRVSTSSLQDLFTINSKVYVAESYSTLSPDVIFNFVCDLQVSYPPAQGQQIPLGTIFSYIFLLTERLLCLIIPDTRCH